MDSWLLKQRLINQQIAGTRFTKPEQVINWMGAVQAQDFAMAKWAVGLRIPGLNDGDVEHAFNHGKILRTHVLRPTWHFVMPADIRWMLELSRSHIIRSLAYNDRKVSLNKNIFTKANAILLKVLQGGNRFTRDELRAIFEKEKIAVNDLRFTHIMIHAELDAIVCSGPRKGKQFTYVLFDERAPNTKTMNHEQALAELTKRYFISHGPATLRDFAWWSGLSVTAARQGIEMLSGTLNKEIIDGKEYLFKPSSMKEVPAETACLLPNFDEYTVAYRDRAILVDNRYSALAINRAAVVLGNSILIDGKVEGTWRRMIKNNSVTVETEPFLPISKKKQQAVKKAVKKYSEFVGKSLE